MIKEKFKNIFSSLKKTKTLLFASVFALFTPLFASAIIDVYGGIIRAVVALFKIPYWLSTYPAMWMADLLQFVTSTDFLIFSYTGVDNPAVAAGLPITQGISNIILILVLLVVIVGIILELNEYGSKKMFVKLLVVALLINFAPLLVGLIVDASNVIMNYFIGGIGDEIKALKHTIMGDGGERATKEIDKQGVGAELTLNLMIPVIILLMQAFINVIMTFVLFLYVLLYVCRYVAIWMIVILSPIAFVCMIHPTTQKLWKDWFKQLMQWSLVGATGAFFLYLSLRINYEMGEAYKTTVIDIGEEGYVSAIFSLLLPLAMVAVFAIMGYMLAIKTSAIGTDKIINFGQSTRRRAQQWGAAGAGAGYRFGKRKVQEKYKNTRSSFANQEAERFERKAEKEEGKGNHKKAAFYRRGGEIRKTQSKIHQEGVDKIHEEAIKDWGSSKKKEELLKELNQPTSGNPNRIRALYNAIDHKDLEGSETLKDQKNFKQLFKAVEGSKGEKTVKELSPVEYLNMKKAEGASDDEIDKEATNIARNGDALKGSAKHIEKRMEEGDERAMKIGRKILEQKASNIQSFVDNAENGMDAFNGILDKYYGEIESAAQQNFKITSPNDKRGAALHAINPSFIKHLEKSPGQIITDIKMPEERTTQSTEDRSNPGPDIPL